MIDEKNLDKWAADVNRYTEFKTNSLELQDLIRLARLGLWAKNHGMLALVIASIPIEDKARSSHAECLMILDRQRLRSYEALAALPKDSG